MSNIPILGSTQPEPDDSMDGVVELTANDCALIIGAAIAYVQQYETGNDLALRDNVRRNLINTVKQAFVNAQPATIPDTVEDAR